MSRYGDPFTTFVGDRVNEGAPGTPTYPRLYEGIYPRREYTAVILQRVRTMHVFLPRGIGGRGDLSS